METKLQPASNGNNQLSIQSLALNATTNIERLIIQASASLPLRQLSDIDKQILNTMAYIALQVGIKETQNPMVVENVAKFIKERFSGLTIKELILAFEMNAAHEFYKKHEHFQQLNIEYVGSVLNSYLAAKRQNAALLKKAGCEAEEPQETTGRESYDALMAICLETKTIPAGWNWEKVYNYLLNEGMVTESDEWKRCFRKEVEKMIASDREREREMAKNEVLRAKIRMKYEEYDVVRRCRIEYVKLKMQNIINESKM